MNRTLSFFALGLLAVLTACEHKSKTKPEDQDFKEKVAFVANKFEVLPVTSPDNLAVVTSPVGVPISSGKQMCSVYSFKSEDGLITLSVQLDGDFIDDDGLTGTPSQVQRNGKEAEKWSSLNQAEKLHWQKKYKKIIEGVFKTIKDTSSPQKT